MNRRITDRSSPPTKMPSEPLSRPEPSPAEERALVELYDEVTSTVERAVRLREALLRHWIHILFERSWPTDMLSDEGRSTIRKRASLAQPQDPLFDVVTARHWAMTLGAHIATTRQLSTATASALATIHGARQRALTRMFRAVGPRAIATVFVGLATFAAAQVPEESFKVIGATAQDYGYYRLYLAASVIGAIILCALLWLMNGRARRETYVMEVSTLVLDLCSISATHEIVRVEP
jgi:hypothetical protein